MKIALSQRIIGYNGINYDSLGRDWYRYFESHSLYAVPNRLDQDFGQLAENSDIFIITGGDDSPVRRVTETKLATQMILRRKPVIGICHGAFMLTSLLGGQIGDIEHHHQTDHVVSYQNQLYNVNSYHSLCITQPPASARVLAIDADGFCEAWIDNNIAAVVWHPERMSTPWLPDEIQALIK